MKKRILISLTVLMMFFSSAPTIYQAKAETENKSLNLANEAQSAILIERDTGKVLFENNIHEKLSPASMTKVMTLLLIMEALDKEDIELSELVQVSEYAASMGGSQIFLAAGEEMSVENLIKGIAIASGNDASVALAERISGSEEAFVKRMNEKAKELGLKNSLFQNSSGLPAENHYSTAHDIAIISKELLKYETITNYTSIYDDYLRKGEKNEFWLVNTNKLVRFYPGVDGLKTGYTAEAKFCLSATALKDDMRVITVVMGIDTAKKRNATVSELLDYGFNHFETEKIFKKGEIITSIQPLEAEPDHIDVVVSESVSTLHKKGEEKEAVVTSVQINETLEFPLTKGQPVGSLTIKQGKNPALNIPLTVNENIQKANYLTLFKRAVMRIAKNK